MTRAFLALPGDPPLAELHLKVHLTYDELVACLFFEAVPPEALNDDSDVRAITEDVIERDGLAQIQTLTGSLTRMQSDGTVRFPAWLALCQQRVSEVFDLPQNQPQQQAEVA